MRNINEFNKYADIENIRTLIAHDTHCDQSPMMHALKPYKDENIGDVLDEIIAKIESDSKYETPRKWFHGWDTYKSFMQYFQRKLTDKKTEQISKNTYYFDMVSPCECDVESVGNFKDTSSILRLKQDTNDTIADLQHVGINAEGLEFINMKLKRCFYHRVHSPVDGKIAKLTPIRKDAPIFGDNSLWVVEIDSDFGPVYVLLVGELSIQEFAFAVKVGQTVKKFDLLGYFNWGSQVVIVYDEGNFQGDCIMRAGQRYFVGDGVYKSWEERRTRDADVLGMNQPRKAGDRDLTGTALHNINPFDYYLTSDR